RGRARSGGVGVLSLAALTFSLIEKSQAFSDLAFPEDGTIIHEAQVAGLDRNIFADGTIGPQDLDFGKIWLLTNAGKFTLLDRPDVTVEVGEDSSGRTIITSSPNSFSEMVRLQGFGNETQGLPQLISTTNAGPPGSGDSIFQRQQQQQQQQD